MKKFYLTLLFILSGCFLWANPVSMESARKVAESFYKHYSPAKSAVIVDSYANDYLGTVTFYTFTFDNGNFIMISADDAVTPVLAYSDEGTFDKNNIPESAQAWFTNYSKEIKYIIDEKIDNTPTQKIWNNISNGVFNDTKAAVTPLCTTTWDQTGYYNDAVETNTTTNIPTGCVATAMAQVMRKWSYPPTGVGSHTYDEVTYGTLTAPFGSTTYTWTTTAMPNSVTSSKPAVATLMYHCGVAVNMKYAAAGSGAFTEDVPYALINFFNYSPSAQVQYLANFTSANWIALLKNELDNARPVIYAGSDASQGGHCFVCDGYDATNKFHFNWGWSGSSDGYFTIGSLNPTGYAFNLSNTAVVRIHPPTSAPVANFYADNTTPAINAPVNFTDVSTNTPTTYSWSFLGGTPSTSTLPNPTGITYAAAGTYQVTLTVTNGTGNDTKTRSGYIVVGGKASAWIKQNSGFPTESTGVDQICILDPNTVWAKGYSGSTLSYYIREFTKTTDGGTTWTPGTITFTNSTNYGVSNLFPLSDQICYACMFPTSGTGGKIVKTIDGGTIWTEQTTAPFTSSWADFVHFFDASNGVCVGDPTVNSGDFVVYTTTNGGTTWTQTAAASIPNVSGTEASVSNMYDTYGNTMWFGTTAGKVYKSTDKGLNWTSKASGLGTSATVRPVFKDANTGIVTGTNTTTGVYLGMKKTIDGGTTWTTVTPTGFYVKSPQIDFVPGTTGMWVDVSSGNGKGSAYSSADCASFVNIDTGSVQYTAVSFYDINTGWAGSFNSTPTNGGIYKWDYSITTQNNDFVDPQTENVTVYPNPASDKLYLGFSIFADKEANVEIFNTIGEKVYSSKVNPIFNPTVEINLPKLETGVYIVSVNTGNTVVTKKITIE